jgi:hypothetical protein
MKQKDTQFASLTVKDGMIVSDEPVKDRLVADGEGELLK